MNNVEGRSVTTCPDLTILFPFSLFEYKALSFPAFAASSIFLITFGVT